MSPILEDLGVDRLSIDERIALAREILDSVIREQGGIGFRRRRGKS